MSMNMGVPLLWRDRMPERALHFVFQSVYKNIQYTATIYTPQTPSQAVRPKASSALSDPMSTASMINDGYHLCFGVEFECILAFHEQLLMDQLGATKDDIRKDLSQDVRKNMSFHFDRKLDYMGWGLIPPPRFPPVEFDNDSRSHWINILARDGSRPYAGEVLHIASRVLSGDVRVHDHLTKNFTAFDKWHLANDTTLQGVSKDMLKEQLEDRLKDDRKDIADWDNHPIELVTRVLPYGEESFEEIDGYLKSLKGNSHSRHKAFVTDHCGLHVHVGRPPGLNFALETLQHLAYMTVVLEPSIGTLHPKYRHDNILNPQPDLLSNREIFEDLWDAEKRNSSETPTQPPEEVNWDESPEPMDDPFNADDAAKRIFATSSIQSLSNLMSKGSRDRIISWTYVRRTGNAAKTIEFRQHEGTLDKDDVRYWVIFLIGLLRLAERMGRGYGNRRPGDDAMPSDVFGLMEAMRLPQEGIDHFREKAERNSGRYDGEDL